MMSVNEQLDRNFNQDRLIARLTELLGLRACPRLRTSEIGLAAVALTASSLLAGFIPAWSAASIEPMQALRTY